MLDIRTPEEMAQRFAQGRGKREQGTERPCVTAASALVLRAEFSYRGAR